MNFTKVKALLEMHEGRVKHAYQDSLGYWTIGVGHCVDKRVAGAELPAEIVDSLLDYDVNKVFHGLVVRLPFFLKLSEVRQAVLIDMAFNLGLAGLSKFTHFLEALAAGDYVSAAKHMLNSKWRSQVENRARRLAAMMSTNRWPD